MKIWDLFSVENLGEVICVKLKNSRRSSVDICFLFDGSTFNLIPTCRFPTLEMLTTRPSLPTCRKINITILHVVPVVPTSTHTLPIPTISEFGCQILLTWHRLQLT